METIYATPLLKPDSPLDAHSRAVIQTIYEAEQAKALDLPTDDPLDPKRRKRVEYTKTEIFEQPSVIQNNLELERRAIQETAAFLFSKPIDRIYLTGCGDSVAAMTGVRAFYETLLGIACEAIQALDLTYYYYHPINPRTLVITLSSSGATTRTVEAMLLARAYGAVTLALSNTPGSALMVESSRGILIHAERRGWPTQSSTAAMAILYQLCLEMAKLKGFSASDLAELEDQFQRVPELIQRILDEQNDQIHSIAERESARSIYLFAGGGPAYACALFGAAKVKECTPNHAIAIPLEEYHHYNSQKLGDPLFLVAPSGASLPRALDTVKECRRWGGQAYSLVTAGDTTLEAYSHDVIRLPRINEMYTPLVYTIPLQLLAYHVAQAKFRNAEMRANEVINHNP